jgi:hypothetical protein
MAAIVASFRRRKDVGRSDEVRTYIRIEALHYQASKLKVLDIVRRGLRWI